MFTPSIVGGGLVGYSFLERTRETQLDTFARSPRLARDMQAFESRIGSVETSDDLLADRELLRVALGAFGLGEDIDNRVFLQKVLDSDIGDPTSLANRLADKRYLALAKAFNFGGQGGARLPGSSAAEDVRAALKSVPSAAALLADDALLARTLKAFDLEGDASRKVFLQKVLTSDPDDANSLVNRLGDLRYVSLARAFQGKHSAISADLVARVSDEVASKLQGLGSADDLLSDRGLLRSTLRVFGLEDQIDNRFVLRDVLNSDLDDPASLANRMGDPAWRDLAAAFDFEARAAASASVYGFAEAVSGKLDTLTTAEALLSDEALLQSVFDVFGLQDVDLDLFEQVLDSDLTDPASVANQQEDPRYRAIAEAFGFAEIAAGTPRAEAQERIGNLITATQKATRQAADVDGLFKDARLMLATTNFFGLPQGASEARFAQIVLRSYEGGQNAGIEFTDDPRYRALYDAMNFQPEPAGRTYPPGFGEAITEAYLERQFEISVGEIDPELRIAMSLERELADVVSRVSTNDARWYAVMASKPLRAAFETTFGLPQSFAALDLDRQLGDLKERSARQFGTSRLADLVSSDTIDTLRQRYLTAVSTAATDNAAAANPVMMLLSGSAGRII
ncbi:DUF1217 domain-containing protein [Roseivivax sediminis]|uniref:Flagellar protein n=1 Tax=Roseivivax sediminis TaxID=936889 RepID=A0A1I1WYZ2_9RHOB|nr:DUF1217 domain-containing protein [Roseivivax sediminis]SFD98673.1 Protein of unknown function [Roseivivax sediminis]